MQQGRMKGYVDGQEAIKQAVYKILRTERYDSIIYSWNYGVELKGLIGKPMPYVKSEVKRRIQEALMQDDRITSVDDFTFEEAKKALLVQFCVHSANGDFTVNEEIAI
ncbi:MAG: DUF2634 domain-containing protein [bacterium]|nr:DUF2634 domain-containing protein [bacterium]